MHVAILSSTSFIKHHDKCLCGCGNAGWSKRNHKHSSSGVNMMVDTARGFNRYATKFNVALCVI